MRKALGFLGVLLAVFPSPVFAHVKWFVEEDIPAVEPFSLREPFVISWIAVCIVIIAIGVVLEKKLPVWSWLGERIGNSRALVEKLLLVFVGVWLLWNAYEGVIFVPVFEVEAAGGELLNYTQAFTGLTMLMAMVIPAFKKIAGVLMLFLGIWASAVFGWLEMLEHLHVFGIGLYLLLLNDKPLEKYSEYALPILRITTGIALIVLAFQEKLLHPELGLQFLEGHNWNFMQMVGIHWFTDRLFVLSAGATEALFGIVFVLGLVTRINTITLVVFFLSTAFILGPMEVLGHLPILGIAIVLATLGGGKKLKVVKDQTL